LRAGETLQIAVGGAGNNQSGGGTFVVGPADTPLVIAGGGGGASLGGPIPGEGGLTEPDGGGPIQGRFASRLRSRKL
jgi:hypothetical protein